MQYSCLLSSNKCYVGLKRFLSHPLFAWFSSSQSTSLGSEKPVLQLLPCSDCEGAGIDGHGCMVNKALEPLRRALKSCKDRAMVALVGLCTLGSWKWKNEAAVYGPVDTIKYPSCSILFKFKWYHLLGCIIFINSWYLHAIFFFFTGILVETSLNIFTWIIPVIFINIYHILSIVPSCRIFRASCRVSSINIY